MITLLRAHLSDEQSIGWPDDAELLAYLDRAADYLSDQLIAEKDPVMLKEVSIGGHKPDDIAFNDNDIAFYDDDPLVPVESIFTLPDDFVAFAGNVPVSVIGREVHLYDYSVSINALYWSRLAHPSSIGGVDEAPYTGEQALSIVDIARLFALNRNEYDISQDMALMGEINKAAAAARRK
jgi:hypothetical protein